MRGSDPNKFADRLKDAAAARAAQLEKARARMAELAASRPQRDAERARIAAERAERETKRKAEKEARGKREAEERAAAEAVKVWDREYNIPQLAAKLEAFVRRHPGRLS